MENNLFNKVVEFVNKSYREKGMEKSIPHFERTVYWMRELVSDPNESLLIAAYSHDIEAIERRLKKTTLTSGFSFDKGEELLTTHQREGARIMYDFLRSEGADDGIANKVHHLIEKHEEGGDEEQNTLKDADSLSYLEVNLPRHLQKTKEGVIPVEEIRWKLDWMFNRITSEKAKEIARLWYKKALETLNNI